MSQFKMYDCDFGFKHNGLSYDFDDVVSIEIEKPEFTRLARGSTGKNKLGIVYKEGIRDPETWTVTLMNIPLEVFQLLQQIYNNKERSDVFCISRSNGSSKMAKNAILCQSPGQLTLDDTPESLNVVLVYQSFDSVENHKE